MNVLILISEVVISYIFLLIVYKKYKEEGIRIWMVTALILSSIMSIKTIEIMGANISLGIGLGTSIYIANNILIQKKGTEYINDIFKLVSVSGILLVIIVMVSKLLTSNLNDIYNIIFVSNIKYIIANIASIIIALYINNKIYYQLRKIKNKIWISNIMSSCIFNFVEVLMFIVIAYNYVDTLYIVMLSLVVKYLIKLVVSVAGTNIIYIANDYK